MQNIPIKNIDFKEFVGKWYSLYSIPTLLDKNWRKTIEYYTLSDKNYIKVLTTYFKKGNQEKKSINSKLFLNSQKPDGDMKAQFLWPFKIGYWIIELEEDYSYVVVGHPEKKYLFIMAREPKINSDKLNEIIQECKQIGYDTDALVSQEH